MKTVAKNGYSDPVDDIYILKEAEGHKPRSTGRTQTLLTLGVSADLSFAPESMLSLAKVPEGESRSKHMPRRKSSPTAAKKISGKPGMSSKSDF